MKRKRLHTVLARAAIALSLAASAASALLFAGMPALAAKPSPYATTMTGPLDNVGDEPRAAGSWTAITYSQFYYGTTRFVVDLTVSCTHLTPGASYVCCAATLGDEQQVSFVAKKNGGSGNLEMKFESFGYGFDPLWIEVYRVDGGNPVLVLDWHW